MSPTSRNWNENPLQHYIVDRAPVREYAQEKKGTTRRAFLPAAHMKTHITIIALTASCLWAQEAAPVSAESAPPAEEQHPAKPVTTPEAPPVELETYLEASHKIAESMKELTGILRQIDSKESADAACEDVGKAARNLLEASRSAERLPAPSSQLQAELVDKLTQSGFINTTQQFLQTLMNLAAHECYESESLQETLKVLEDTEPGT